jgi:hypothetical protein
MLLQLWPFSVIKAQSGIVFRDFNGNGTKDTYEPGVAGVLVKSYNQAGAQVGTTATSVATTGAWSISSGTTATVRVEFELPTSNSSPIGPLASIDFSTSSGATYGSSVQFVVGNATGVNFAIFDPNDYWDNSTDPRYVLPCYVSGTASGTAATDAAIVSTPYSSTGLNSAYSPGTGPMPRIDATVGQVGTVWGAAYHRKQKHFYFSTFLKRHCGIADGPGFIYNFDYSTTTASLAGKFNLQGAMPNNGGASIDFGSVTRTGGTDFTLPANKTSPSIDLDAYAKVATISYGDLEMQPSSDYLWAVNLFQKALIRIDVSGNPVSLPSGIEQYILSSLPGYPSSTTGVLQPWALSFNAGKGYLGVVADASISKVDADLSAIVLQFDPNNIAAGFTQVLSFDPNIKRSGFSAFEKFHYWLHTYTLPPVLNPVNNNMRWSQPILADITFDENGNIYTALMDRFAHQVGHQNYSPVSGSTTLIKTFAFGEMLKACINGTTWTVEGLGSCHVGAEFFQDISGDNSKESVSSGSVSLKGKNQILQVSIDPHPQGMTGSAYFNTQGTNTYNLTTGAIDNWYSVYSSASLPLLGKASGLGDIEIITDPPPIEIGNRIWNDTDNDGLQDPGELGIGNVTLVLYADFDNNGVPDGAALGTTTSSTTPGNALGTWYFNSGNVTDGDPSTAGNQPGLASNKKYLVRIASADWTSGAGTGDLLGLVLTSSNVAPTAGLVDVSDNDAAMSASIPTIGYTTGVDGLNNHTLDFGFKTCQAISAPSASQNICLGNSGADITAQTDYNTTNSIRFVKFATDQMAGSTPTALEATAIYAGTAMATVTPTGGMSPYTATYTWSNTDFPSAGNYYIYAILNSDAGENCRPIQEILVTMVQPADAGTDGSTSVCDNSSTIIDLFSLISGEQAGGAWTRTTGTGGTFDAGAGTFTPAAGASTSTFTYTVTGTSPCLDDTAIGTVNISPVADAGTDGSTSVCDNSSTIIDLFSLISGEQAGGAWTRTTGTGGTFDAGAGTFTPAAGASTSTFTYTVTGTSPCLDDTAIGTVNISPVADAGTDGSTSVCDNSSTTIDLFSLISGEQAGGAWTRTTGSGGTFDALAGTFTPAAGASTSTFTYTVTGTSPCLDDAAIATVNISPVADAGTDGSTSVCDNSSTTIDLFSLISGEQAGGAWTRTTGSGGTFDALAGTFTPAAGASTSTFTYTVTGTSPCLDDAAIATVNISPVADAGTDGSTSVCDNSSTTIDLFSLISGEQAGGAWTRTTGTGGTFDAGAGTFTPAAGASTSTFTYTVTGTSPCLDDTAIGTVNISPVADAGTDGSTSVCDNSSTTIDLFSLISGEQAGGAWTRTTGSGGTFDALAGTFTPAAGASTSTFTYTVTGTSPCLDDAAIATVNISPVADAGTDGSTSVCDNSSTTIDLFSLISGEQAGGAWTRTTGTGGTFDAGAGTFTPAAGASTSTFTYTVTGTSPCLDDTAIGTVNISPVADAGTDGSTSVCDNSSTTIDLFSLISGEQAGGAWTRTTGSGGTFDALAGTFTPAAGASTSTFTYTVTGTSPCLDDAAIATVNISPVADAGTDGSTSVCDNSSTTIDLFSLISGEQAGGAWTRTTGTGGTFDAGAGTFTPAAGASTSTFTYTVTGTSPCLDDTAIGTVNISPVADAGTDGSTSVCDNSSTTIDLFSLISGEQAGGAWTRTTGTGGTFDAGAGTFTPAAGASTSTFTYTVTGTSPCLDDAAIVTVNIWSAPTLINVTQTAATCTGATADNNGVISLIAGIEGTHFGVSTIDAMTYNGPMYAGAATFSLPQVAQTNVPNTGGTYIIRVFNGSDDCFLDMSVTVTPVMCCSVPNCGTATILKN